MGLRPGAGTCASGEDDPTPTLLRGHKASLVYDEKAEHNGGKIAESVRHEEECDKVGKGKGTFKGGCKGKGKGSQRDTAQLADVVEVEANDEGGRTAVNARWTEQQLLEKTVEDLYRLARSAGVDAYDMWDAMDSDDPKAALMGILLK